MVAKTEQQEKDPIPAQQEAGKEKPKIAPDPSKKEKQEALNAAAQAAKVEDEAAARQALEELKSIPGGEQVAAVVDNATSENADEGGMLDGLMNLGKDLFVIVKDLLARMGVEFGDKDISEEEDGAVESAEFGELLDPDAKVFSFPAQVDGEPVQSRVTSEFGLRGKFKTTDGHGSKDHKGEDIGVAEGTPIALTAAQATVLEVGSDGAKKGRGNYVKLQLEDGSTAVFMHLKEAPSFEKGQVLETGATIGLSGKTGNVNGPHLHFEIHQNGAAVDPTPWLAKRYQV